MRTDTPTAGGEQIIDEFEGDVLHGALRAAEWVLADRFGSPIMLTEPEDLAGSGPAAVVRVRVESSPFSLPKTLVVKHYRQAAGFATEAASYQLFTALAAEQRMCPEPIGHDKTRRVLVLSDLGRAQTLEDKLREEDAKDAESALLSWARALGRMHATTARREADFDTLLRRLGGRKRDEESAKAAVAGHLAGVLDEVLGVPTPRSVRAEVVAAIERVDAGRCRAFSPVDLSPENNLVTNSGVRFLDFEHGRVRNALIDVAHLRVPFAFWHGALGLPAGMSEAMIAAWRSEVLETWPQLADTTRFTAAMLDSHVLCVWKQTALELPGLAALPEVRSGPTSRVAALHSWWQELAHRAESAEAGGLAAHANAVAEALDVRFGPGLELATYPAFR